MANEVQTERDTSKSAEPGSLLIENSHSYTAEVAVNGTRIGTVGPYTDAALHGLAGGLYDVRFTHTSGYSYFEAVRTSTVDRPIVPGGKVPCRCRAAQQWSAGEHQPGIAGVDFQSFCLPVLAIAVVNRTALAWAVKRILILHGYRWYPASTFH